MIWCGFVISTNSMHNAFVLGYPLTYSNSRFHIAMTFVFRYFLSIVKLLHVKKYLVSHTCWPNLTIQFLTQTPNYREIVSRQLGHTACVGVYSKECDRCLLSWWRLCTFLGHVLSAYLLSTTKSFVYIAKWKSTVYVKTFSSHDRCLCIAF